MIRSVYTFLLDEFDCFIVPRCHWLVRFAWLFRLAKVGQTSFFEWDVLDALVLGPFLSNFDWVKLPVSIAQWSKIFRPAPSALNCFMLPSQSSFSAGAALRKFRDRPPRYHRAKNSTTKTISITRGTHTSHLPWFYAVQLLIVYAFLYKLQHFYKQDYNEHQNI